MKSVLIVLMLCTSFLFCVAQKADSLVYEVITVEENYLAKEPSIEDLEYWEQKRENTTSNDYIIPLLIVEDFDLRSTSEGQTLFINDSGEFQFEGSVLFSGKLLISLQSCMVVDKSEIGNIGRLSGIVKNGRKEGEWVLKHSGEEGWITTKTMNYKNGLLHGDYFVYTHEGEVISCEQSAEGGAAATSTFINGTGLYVDFYNFPPYQLKVQGRLVKGKKNGRWNVYDKNGDIIVSYIYQNGIIVNL